jgi:hypothetical protein
MAKTAMCVFCCVAALAVMVPSTQAAVAVGSSSLIEVLDYSDTFTAYDYGGLEDRDGTGGFWPGYVDYPADGRLGQGLMVENNYGNPVRWWSDGKWSFNTDATAVSGNSTYPGTSGAGSDTGITQTGGEGAFDEWGIEYALRNRFVVQYDAVQTEDRVSFIASEVRDTIWHPTSIAVNIRLSGNLSGWPEVGIFNSGVGEFDTGLSSPIYYADEWHNYAALFDVSARTIEVFVDEVTLGVINLDTVGDGAFAPIPLSNSTVSVSYSQTTTTGDRFWSDNFQVGSPDPGSPQIPGDATLDGNVDGEDAARLAENWGAQTLINYDTWWEMGDFDGDHYVGPKDASIMSANWGYTASETSAPVPEPSVALMLLAGVWILVGRRR